MSAKRPCCNTCLRPLKVCYCHTIETIKNAWPVHILQHNTEINKAVATARIAALSLRHCELILADNVQRDSMLHSRLLQLKPLLIYPGEDSVDVTDINAEHIRPLLFIDGTWRKTRRMLHESPLLSSLPKVSFTTASESIYRIRKVPHKHALSTVESIAHVLSVLESDAQKYSPLLSSMKWMIDQQIKAMGEQTYRANYVK